MIEENKVPASIAKFDYNTTILNKVAEDARAIDITDMAQVEEKKKELVTLRGKIETQGRGFREQAIANNKIIQKEENYYVAIIEPIEIEYKEILKKEEARKLIEIRKELLPMKKKQLQFLIKIELTDDDTLLAMDDDQWIAYYNSQFKLNEERIQHDEIMARREKERKEREVQIRAEMDEKAKIDAELALKRAEKDKINAVLAEKVKAEQLVRDKINAVQAEKLKAEQLVRKQKEMADKAKQDELQAFKDKTDKEVADKARLDANKKYQEFLSSNNYNEGTDIVQNSGGKIKIYRLVAVYN